MHALQIFSLAYRASWKKTGVCCRCGKVGCTRLFQLVKDQFIFVGSVNLTADGKAALLKLSKGDMRRALNILQACHAAYDIVGETEIYSCTGNPHPSDIEIIVNSMLADEFTTSYQSKPSSYLSFSGCVSRCYSDLQTQDRAWSCTSRLAYRSVWIPGDCWSQAQRQNLSPWSSCDHRVRIPFDSNKFTLTGLIPSRYRLAAGGNEKMQLSALLGAVKNTVELTAKSAWYISFIMRHFLYHMICLMSHQAHFPFLVFRPKCGLALLIC